MLALEGEGSEAAQRQVVHPDYRRRGTGRSEGPRAGELAWALAPPTERPHEPSIGSVKGVNGGV